MSAYPKKFHIAALITLILLGTYFSADFLAKRRVAELQTTIEGKINTQKETLSQLSEITARNGADEATEAIVQDCSIDERKEFDVLLGRLDEGLPQSELLKLDRLFGRCGYFFAQRKSIMVARLAREVELYKSYVAELETLTGSSKQDEYMVETWYSLAQDEQKQSDLFVNLVLSQDRIIATLLQGKSATSEEIKTILNDVKETQGTLTVTSKQTADLRAVLVSQ